jgi:alkaline phosphatase
MDLGEGEAGEMRRTYTLAMLWAGLACSAVLMASQASAEPSLDQRPLRERIAAEDAKERAQDVASRAASTGHNKRLGNAIFLHPDGSGPAMWQAGRVYWKGPDENLFWDRLPYKAMYRGHANDLRSSGRKGLTISSNGGATTHAFGFKVQAPDSFGQDGSRPIIALSGYRGSIMCEAANKGHPVGVVNDGDLPEPGTGAFLAEVARRGEGAEILEQMIFGRSGMNDRPPAVLLGGGEGFALPAGTAQCAAGAPADDCYLHTDPVTGAGPERTDGRNLIQEAKAAGFVVLRSRGEFEALMTQLKSRPQYAPKVLGLFGRDDIFNDVAEERLIELGLVKGGISSNDKRGRLILYGTPEGTPGFNPPTAAEMTEMALIVLERSAATVGKPFMLVAEVEGTDNFGNSNNAIGSLVALKNADDMIAVSRMFQGRVPDTLILTAADGDAGQMTVLSKPPLDSSNNTVGTVNYNPTEVASPPELRAPVDGIEGRATPPFQAEPDDFGTVYPFAIAWIGTDDNYGAMVTRAQGLNARLLQSAFAARFDNTDVYRMMYLTLFGKFLPPAYGRSAPMP